MILISKVAPLKDHESQKFRGEAPIVDLVDTIEVAPQIFKKCRELEPQSAKAVDIRVSLGPHLIVKDDLKESLEVLRDKWTVL
jgi:hypothetical protein